MCGWLGQNCAGLTALFYFLGAISPPSRAGLCLPGPLALTKKRLFDLPLGLRMEPALGRK
jgi:hypothetical protein